MVPETRACGMTREIAFVSGPSPVGVAVACALTCPTSSGVRPESAHGEAHRPLDAAALLVGGGHVVGVRRAPVARDGGDGLRTPALGVLGALQDQGSRALAHHEAVARLVERPARAVRLIVAPGDCPDRAETRHGKGRDRGLGRAGDHHVGVAAPDQLQPLGDRLCPGRARENRALARSGGAEHDRELSCGHVGDHHGDQERADPAGPPLVQDAVLALPGGEPADAAAHHDRDALRPLAHEIGYPRALARPRDPPRCRAGRSGPSCAPPSWCM